MKLSLFSLLLFIVPLTTSNRLQAEDKSPKPKKIINQSIKALGGAEKLKKFTAFTGKDKGTYYGMGEGVPYTGIHHIQFPYHFRVEIEGVFTMVYNGKKGWTKMGDTVTEMTKEQFEETGKQTYTGWVTTLTPLKDKSFTLALIGDETINDRPAVGVMVTRKNQRDVSLYFDKKNHLLVKAAYTVLSPEHGNKEVLEELFYSKYKEVQGIQTASKSLIMRDGKKFVESEFVEMKYAEKLDADLFEKP